MNEQKRKSVRLPLLIMALVFFGPLIVAAWMYMTGHLTPAGRSDHGAPTAPAPPDAQQGDAASYARLLAW